MKNVKEKWVEPHLMVLMRGRPEEAVLLTCKDGSWMGSSNDPGVFHAQCYQGGLEHCITCAFIAAS